MSAPINQSAIQAKSEDWEFLGDPTHDHILPLGAYVLLDLMLCVFTGWYCRTKMSSKPRWFRHLISIIAIVDFTVAMGILACVMSHYFTPATGVHPELQMAAHHIRNLSKIAWMLVNATIRNLAVIIPSNHLAPHPINWKRLAGLYVALVPITLLVYTYQPTVQYNYFGRYQTISTEIAMALLMVKANPIWVVYTGYRLIHHYGEEDCIAYRAVYPTGITEVPFSGHKYLTDTRINHNGVQPKPHRTGQDQKTCGDIMHLYASNNGNNDIIAPKRGTNRPSLASLDRLQISDILVMAALLMGSVCLTIVVAFRNAFTYDIQAIAFSSVVGSTAWLLVLLHLPIKESVNDHQDGLNFEKNIVNTTKHRPVSI